MQLIDTSLTAQIELKLMRPSQFSVRDRSRKMPNEDDALLSNSIREHGLLQTILTRQHIYGFEIVAGHWRFQAC